MIQIAQMALLIYGILLVVGGVMGKVKAGSSVSLGAGVASGVIAFVGYWYSLNDPANGFMIGAMLGLLLTGVFVNRFMRTRKVMPAGLVLILSLAVGILCDVWGNDVYRASWLAQGAGNANGIGMLDDVDGNDHYVAERNDAQGYGTPSRNYGSMGLLIDRAGKDVYEGSGGEGQVWMGGFYGGGIDWPILEMGTLHVPKR